MKYELFYSTGGHGGPYEGKAAAKKGAEARLRGSRADAWIKVVPYSQPWEATALEDLDGLRGAFVVHRKMTRSKPKPKPKSKSKKPGSGPTKTSAQRRDKKDIGYAPFGEAVVRKRERMFARVAAWDSGKPFVVFFPDYTETHVASAAEAKELIKEEGPGTYAVEFVMRDGLDATYILPAFGLAPGGVVVRIPGTSFSGDLTEDLAAVRLLGGASGESTRTFIAQELGDDEYVTDASRALVYSGEDFRLPKKKPVKRRPKPASAPPSQRKSDVRRTQAPGAFFVVPGVVFGGDLQSDVELALREGGDDVSSRRAVEHLFREQLKADEFVTDEKQRIFHRGSDVKRALSAAEKTEAASEQGWFSRFFANPDSHLWHVVDREKFFELYGELEKTDAQSADLLRLSAQELEGRMEVDESTQRALNRLRNLVYQPAPRSGSSAAAQRNQVFKIANELGLKLPSFHFNPAGWVGSFNEREFARTVDRIVEVIHRAQTATGQYREPVLTSRQIASRMGGSVAPELRHAVATGVVVARRHVGGWPGSNVYAVPSDVAHCSAPFKVSAWDYSVLPISFANREKFMAAEKRRR